MKILILFLFASNVAFAQYWGMQEIDEQDLSPWLPTIQTDYEGSYRFGESECESSLYLFFSDGYIVGQITMGEWVENTGERKTSYINLRNITIDKNGKLTSDNYTGQFVLFKTSNGKVHKCLKIDNSWTCFIEENKFEIGTQSSLKLDFNDLYPGKYPEASFRKLELKELHKMTKEQLSIMRNEIYARYGYAFREKGKMDTYFNNQSWYQSQHQNVNSFLTVIERYNIELIKGLE